jgi:hypothetical protein
MALSPGARLGPYEILSAIGAGGMREVYRARDGKLNRDLAILTQGDSFVAGKPRLWSDKPILNVGFTNLDLAPDGKRFAIFPKTETAEPNGPRRVTFLLNFIDDLGRRIPRGRK